jgi:hypothetical protein
MLQGLEDMLVHLTDAADRAHSSALVQPIVQGLKLRSKEIHKGPRLCRRCALGRENSPTNPVAEGSTPTEPRGQLPIAVQGARRSTVRLRVILLKARALFDYELLLAAVDRRGGDVAHFCLILCQGKGSR